MSDMFDALISDQPIDTADLANRLRKKEALGTLAALTGISGLQKLGPQMVEDAGKGAQYYAALRDRTENQKLQRTLQAQGQQNENTRAADALAERRQRDNEMVAYRMDALDARNREATATAAAKVDAVQEKLTAKATTDFDKKQTQYAALADNLDSAMAAVQQLHDHKGLDAITGLVGGHTWDVTDKARSAAAQLGNIQSHVMLNAMAALKAASPTGSTGFGQLSNIEGEILRNSIASLDRAQPYEDMKASLETINKYFNLAKQRAKEGLDRSAATMDTFAPPTGALPRATGSALPGNPHQNTAEYDSAIPPLAPQGAVAMLKANPALAPLFKKKYGYLPQ